MQAWKTVLLKLICSEKMANFMTLKSKHVSSISQSFNFYSSKHRNFILLGHLISTKALVLFLLKIYVDIKA